MLPYSPQLEYLCRQNNKTTQHHGQVSKEQQTYAKVESSRKGSTASGAPRLRNAARIGGGNRSDYGNSRRRNAAQCCNACSHHHSAARSGQFCGKRTRRFQILKGAVAPHFVRATHVLHLPHTHAAAAPHTCSKCRTTASKTVHDVYIP